MIMRQHVLDEEVKENQRREAVIWKLETVLRRRKAKLAKIRRELGPMALLYVTIRDYSASKSTARKVKVITNRHANVYSFNPPQAIAIVRQRLSTRSSAAPVRWGR